MTIIVVGVVGTAGGVFLLWAVWWIYRGTPKHGKHHTTLPPADLAKAMHEVRASGMRGADSMAVLKAAAADTETWPTPTRRHTHRDPTTGRYTRREQ